MLKNSTITPTLRFEPQQNIAQSKFFPHHYKLGKKSGLMLRISLSMKFRKIGEIWKELGQTKSMRPTGIFSDHSFGSYSSFKMTCLKRKVKTAAFFCD
jgi:hypothetical protein